MSKFWNFIKNEATPGKVELRIEGDIIDDDDAWIYEWFGIPVASPNAFRKELEQFAGQNITVWINSYGGSVFAATGIYNALMAHKSTGAEVTTIGDAKVMSAAVTISMAGDKRYATPGCVYMVHNPLTYAGGYASDLRKVADILDVVKESIMNALERSGLSREKISALMDEETYMSANTAVSYGFATEVYVLDNQNNQGSDIVNFNFPRLAIQNAANDSMRKLCDLAKKLESENQAESKPSESIMAEAKKLLAAAWQSFSVQNKQEEEIELKITNTAELQQAFPDLVNQITTDAVKNALKSETERITALDALAVIGNAAVQDLINDAKANGKTAADIKAAVDIMVKHVSATQPQNKGLEHLNKVIGDSKNSGAEKVHGDGGASINSDDQEEIDAVNFMSGILNQKFGGKQ